MKALEELYYLKAERRSKKISEVKQTHDALYSFIEQHINKSTDFARVDDLIMENATAIEKQGFTDGFQYAMQIANESFAKDGEIPCMN